MHWQYRDGKADYCTEDIIVGRIQQLPNGSWAWWLLRYSNVQGQEQTQRVAQQALEAAWLKHTEWMRQ